MNSLAIAGGTPPLLILLALVFWGGGIAGMLWSAVVCFKKKSAIAGCIAILIIISQGAITQPWHSQIPCNANDADEVEDIRQGRQIGILWMGFSAVSLALVVLAPIRKGKASASASKFFI